MKATDLKEASFRGIPFAARGIGGNAGRRVVVHEYPGRDDVTTDDLGRAMRIYRLEAVVTGADWQTRYRDLLTACEEPGIGELVHPEGFRKRVVPFEPAEYTVSSVGEVILSLTFVEVADAPVLTAEPDPISAVIAAASSLFAGAKADLERAWDTAAGAVGVVTDALDTVTGIIRTGMPGTGQANALAALRDIEGSVRDLAMAPADLADAWAGFFDAVADPTTLKVISDRYAAGTAVSVGFDLLPTPYTRAAALNTHALDRFLWIGALGSLAGTVAGTIFRAFDDANEAVRDLSGRTVAAEAFAGSSAVVIGLADLRGALVSGVLVVAQELPRLRNYTPGRVASAAEVAQRLYRDGTRADEIAARNGIQHPGFIPANYDLRVLTA